MRLLVTRFYLAFQDGRAELDTEYWTREEAEEALAGYDPINRRGICIVAYEKEVFRSESE